MELATSGGLRMLLALGFDATDALSVLFVGQIVGAFSGGPSLCAGGDHRYWHRLGPSAGCLDHASNRGGGDRVEFFVLSVSAPVAFGLLARNAGHRILLWD